MRDFCLTLPYTFFGLCRALVRWLATGHLTTTSVLGALLLGVLGYWSLQRYKRGTVGALTAMLSLGVSAGMMASTARAGQLSFWDWSELPVDAALSGFYVWCLVRAARPGHAGKAPPVTR